MPHKSFPNYTFQPNQNSGLLSKSIEELLAIKTSQIRNHQVLMEIFFMMNRNMAILNSKFEF